jgi:hypothetical protein
MKNSTRGALSPEKPKGHRDGESPKTHYRSERVVHINGDWFVTTREGFELGPYATHDLAKVAATRLSAMLEGVVDPEIACQLIRYFALLSDGSVQDDDTI